MKKIVLGCAAVLLSLGLLAGCNKDDVDDKINNTGPEENEPTDDGNEGTTNTGPGPETGGEGGEPEGTTTYKLGFCDDDNYCYRWFDGTSFTTESGQNVSGPFLETTTEWESAVDVIIAEAEPEIEIDDDVTAYACTISFTDASETVQYLSWSSSTAIDFSEEEYVWYWVEGETYSYFCTALDGRYIAAYNDSIRAYAMSNLSNYKPASVYTTEPDPIVNPNAGLSLTAVDSLTDGGQYYIGAVADAELGTYYLFDGENYSDQQLVGSQVLANAVVVTATGSENSWTLTCTIGGVEHTIYTYISGSYCEISTVASTELNSTLTGKTGASTFAWDSTYHGVTVTLSSTTYFLAQNRSSSYAYEFQMAGYSDYANSDTWASFYAVE